MFILQSEDLLELRFDPIDVMRFIDDDLLVHCANRQTEADGSGWAGSVSAMFSITSWGGNAREFREEQIACRRVTCSSEELPLVLLQLFRPNLVGHRVGPRNEHGKARTPGPTEVYILWYVAGSALG